MSCIPIFWIRRYDTFSDIHISPLIRLRICRAFSRPVQKHCHTDPGFDLSNVRSSASVKESASRKSSSLSTSRAPPGGTRPSVA